MLQNNWACILFEKLELPLGLLRGNQNRYSTAVDVLERAWLYRTDRRS